MTFQSNRQLIVLILRLLRTVSSSSQTSRQFLSLNASQFSRKQNMGFSQTSTIHDHQANSHVLKAAIDIKSFRRWFFAIEIAVRSHVLKYLFIYWFDNNTELSYRLQMKKKTMKNLASSKLKLVKIWKMMIVFFVIRFVSTSSYKSRSRNIDK